MIFKHFFDCKTLTIIYTLNTQVPYFHKDTGKILYIMAIQ
mgnify:CR=1 FL=1